MSRALRVAMSAEDWDRFDALVAEASMMAASRARANGVAISRLIHDPARPSSGPTDWMDWERQKTLRLLRRAN